jgi:hypothetical protein
LGKSFGVRGKSLSLAVSSQLLQTAFLLISLEAIAKPVLTFILNEVKGLNSLKMRDSSLRSE